MVAVTRRPPHQAGYNLVFLVIFVGLLSVMAAAALPAIKLQMQREKEAELIFRGLQYAEGIRVFQQRFGRHPNTLDELIELEPRSMRQLWADPLSKDGRWGLVLASASVRRDGGGQPAGSAGDEDDGGTLGRDLGGGTAPTSSFRADRGSQASQAVVGPIIGVVSRAKGSATRTFMDKDVYEEWRFTASILPRPQVAPGTSIIIGTNVDSLGKPFPRQLKAPGLAAMTEGSDLAGGDTPSDLFEDEEEDG